MNGVKTQISHVLINWRNQLNGLNLMFSRNVRRDYVHPEHCLIVPAYCEVNHLNRNQVGIITMVTICCSKSWPLYNFCPAISQEYCRFLKPLLTLPLDNPAIVDVVCLLSVGKSGHEFALT